MNEYINLKQSAVDDLDRTFKTFCSGTFNPIPTGIPTIDAALGGGLTSGTLVMLGAPPAAGKTSLMSWVLENVAESGRASIYLNLEMSKAQLLSRSLSRVLAEQFDVYMSPLDIMRGQRWTDEQREAVTKAANWYREHIAPRMAYNPSGVSSDLDDILAYIERVANASESAGDDVPIICVDYLQILHGKPGEDSVDIIKRAVDSFQRFAKAHSTVVICIMAHNRTSNKTGQVTMESGRDTSAIEYSADLQLGLAFTKCLPGESDEKITPDALDDEDRTWVSLMITKSRMTSMNHTRTDLIFDGMSMTFKDNLMSKYEMKEREKREELLLTLKQLKKKVAARK